MNLRLHELARVIAQEQRPDGSFETWSVAAGNEFDDAAVRRTTTFTTAVIVEAIAGVELPGLDQVRERAVDWLLAQRGPQWSFNYWPRDSAEADRQPYPDDWDDTSCALSAIALVRPDALSGAALAAVISLLTNTETAEGGPYRTWIVEDTAELHWQDVDMAVNSNIAYFLSLQGVDLPNLEALVDDAVRQNALHSPYYPTVQQIWYFIARWYRGGSRAKLRDEVLEGLRRSRSWDPLQTALAVTAGLNLGEEPDQLARWARNLERRPLAEVTRAYAFCFDPAVQNRAHVAGSPALTAALVLEALHKAGSASAKPTGGELEVLAQKPARDVHARVVSHVRQRLEGWSDEVSAAAEQMLERVLTDDPARQVTLLPYLFREALGSRGRSISDDRVIRLGILSLYGWLAYTIYDDFLDNEGRPPLLPLANVALRELARILAGERSELNGLAWQILDQMEAANAWEAVHCRIAGQAELLRVAPPDYGDLSRLAHRSLGHALGGLAMMLELGYAPESPGVSAILAFFEHFLIARQLNDEAHDWKPDLERGHVNAVGARLLAQIPRRGRSVPGLYGRLEQQFWEQGIIQTCELVEHELAAARRSLAECPAIERPELFEALLKPIEAAINQAKSQQRQTLEFLQAYKKQQQK